MRRIRDLLRRNVAISCWHIAEHESSAMWAVYAERGNGIVLRSTYARLVNSARDWPDDCYVGLVKYVDYETSVVGSGNFLSPFVHKRLEFQSERELRVAVSRMPTTGSEGMSVIDYSGSMPSGLLARVDLDALLESVVLAPRTPAWQADAIRSITTLLGFSIPIERSSLDRTAILG